MSGFGSKADLNMTSRDFRLPVLTDFRFGSQSRHRPATTRCRLMMLWTAPPPGTRVPWMWGLVRLPSFGGATHATGHDNRSGYREVCFSGTRRRCGWSGGYPSSVEASLCFNVFPEAAAMPCRYRGLCFRASLVARTQGAWSPHTIDTAGLREALCQAP